jgi:hypothetical protein
MEAQGAIVKMRGMFYNTCIWGGGGEEIRGDNMNKLIKDTRMQYLNIQLCASRWVNANIAIVPFITEFQYLHMSICKCRYLMPWGD